MATDAQLQALYARIRAQLLARNFALGRFFRTNFYGEKNLLGDRRNFDGVSAKCLAAERQRPPAYRNAEELLNLDEAGGTFERWRIFRHDRENPVMLTGMRLIDAAVEFHLGHTEAKKILLASLATLDSLYKVRDESNPFSGYIIRFDAATSDQWEIEVAGGREVPVACCNFFINPDGGIHKEQPYLFCIPLWDPRYHQAKESPDINHNHFLRRWEPSMDELVGLVTGYFIVHALVDDAEVKEQVKSQARRLGNYLAHTGYMLVRPCGGFAARGSAGILPCLEYPFVRVFERITGESNFSSRATFDDALDMAQAPKEIKQAMRLVGGVLAFIGFFVGVPLGLIGLVLSVFIGIGLLISRAFGGPDLLAIVPIIAAASGISLVPGIGGAFVGWVVGQMLGVYLERGRFDVWDDSMQGEFAIAYLLKWTPVKWRFKEWMAAKPYPGSETESARWADQFKRFIGLTALDDADATVRNAYLDWYDQWGNLDPGNEIEGTLDDDRKAAWCATMMSTAVASLLRSRPADEERLANAIHKAHDGLAGRRKANLLIVDDGDLVNEIHDKADPVGVSVWFGGYLTPLALAWLHERRKKPADLPANFPKAPTSFADWPRPVLPASVIRAAQGGQLTVPLEAVRQSSDPLPSDADADLFDNPPPKPNDGSMPVPPPIATRHHVDLREPHDWRWWPHSKRDTFRLGAPAIEPNVKPRYTLVPGAVTVHSTTIRASIVSVEDPRIENEQLVVTAEVTTGWFWEFEGRYVADYTVAWVRQQF
jgi:hypothetical protein